MTNNTPDYNDNLYFEKKKMTDITEQWKKGELPSGEYYIKVNGVEDRDRYFNGYGFSETEPADIEQVLTPVPSYDEWKYKCERDRKQNVQLKDLLKEIRLMMSIERDFASGHFEKSKLTELLTKIDEVLK